MTTSVNPAGMAGALDKMTSGLAAGMQDRDKVALEKQTIERKMASNKHAMSTGADQEEMDRITAENKALSGKMDKENLFRGLDHFTVDQNPRHLNGFLHMPIFKNAGIARFSKIDKVADSALIAQAGLDMEDLSDTSFGGTGDSARYVKRIMQDGTEAIQDIYKVKQMSGYFKNLTDKQTEAELKLNEDTKERRKGEWDDKSSLVEEYGVDTKKNAIAALYTDMQLGNKGGGEIVANQARQSLDEEYGGSFSTNFDPEDEAQRAKAYPRIRAIEKFGDVKLDVGTKKALVNIGKLVSLGEPLSELKEEETGLYDAFTFKLEKYWSDEGGSESAASFAAFRNVIRHTLYGSALTDSEIAAFDEQLGTTSKKLGPLLKESATALGEVQGQINVLVALNDPYVVAYRMGINMDKLEDIQYNLGRTIKYLERKAQGKTAIDPRKTKDERIKAMEDQI